jgi:hypothetical protein
MTRSRIPPESPAVERVRAARRALAKDCRYDVSTLGQYLMARQGKSKQKLAIPGRRPAHT